MQALCRFFLTASDIKLQTTFSLKEGTAEGGREREERERKHIGKLTFYFLKRKIFILKIKLFFAENISESHVNLDEQTPHIRQQ